MQDCGVLAAGLTGRSQEACSGIEQSATRIRDLVMREVQVAAPALRSLAHACRCASSPVPRAKTASTRRRAAET